jgi:hypothetical protein
MSRASRGLFVDRPSSLNDVAGSAGRAPLVAEGGAWSAIVEVWVVGGLGLPRAVFCVFAGGVEMPLASPGEAMIDESLGAARLGGVGSGGTNGVLVAGRVDCDVGIRCESPRLYRLLDLAMASG